MPFGREKESRVVLEREREREREREEHKKLELARVRDLKKA